MSNELKEELRGMKFADCLETLITEMRRLVKENSKLKEELKHYKNSDSSNEFTCRDCTYYSIEDDIPGRIPYPYCNMYKSSIVRESNTCTHYIYKPKNKL